MLAKSRLTLLISQRETPLDFKKTTAPEEKALRLLRLCAAPQKIVPMKLFFKKKDVRGNFYSDIFISLQKKGKIRFGKRIKPGTIIKIL